MKPSGALIRGVAERQEAGDAARSAAVFAARILLGDMAPGAARIAAQALNVVQRQWYSFSRCSSQVFGGLRPSWLR